MVILVSRARGGVQGAVTPPPPSSKVHGHSGFPGGIFRVTATLTYYWVPCLRCAETPPPEKRRIWDGGHMAKSCNFLCFFSRPQRRGRGG